MYVRPARLNQLRTQFTTNNAMLTDDTTYEVKPGDAMFCQNGSRHGLENTGDEDLVFMGLIIYDN